MKDWNNYFLDIAESIAKQNSSCIRRQYGCVLVRSDKSIISTGYNGAVQGMTSCGERGSCWRSYHNIESGTQIEKCYAVHAEQNALMFAAKHGSSVKNSLCYVTANPCPVCLRLLMQAGVKAVYYRYNYPIDWEPYNEFSNYIFMQQVALTVKE